MELKRGVKYLVVALATFPFLGAISILVFGPPHSSSMAVWFFAISMIFGLFVIFSIIKQMKGSTQTSKNSPTVFFKGALVFFCGAVYGVWQFTESGWKWADLLVLAVPVGLTVWLTRLGIAEHMRGRASLGERDRA